MLEHIIKVLLSVTRRGANETIGCLKITIVLFTTACACAFLLHQVEVGIFLLFCAMLVLVTALCRKECKKYDERRAARAAKASSESVFGRDSGTESTSRVYDTTVTANMITNDETTNTLVLNEVPPVDGSQTTIVVTVDSIPSSFPTAPPLDIIPEELPPMYEECPPYEDIQEQQQSPCRST